MLHRFHEAIHLRIRYSQVGAYSAVGGVLTGERDTYVVGYEGLGHMLFRADKDVAEEDGFLDRQLFVTTLDEGLGSGEEKLDMGCREKVAEAERGRGYLHFEDKPGHIELRVDS